MSSQQGKKNFLNTLNEVRDATNNVSRSKVDVILKELEHFDQEMHDDLIMALKDTSYSASNIAKTLKSFDYNISDSSVKRWRAINNG